MPAREQTAIEEFGVQGRPGRFLLGLSSIFGVFLLPGVRRSTGISLLQVGVAWSVLAIWFSVAHRLLYKRAARHPAAFYALLFGNMSVGAVVSLSFPVLAGKPDTTLWLAFAIMACIDGAAEAGLSIILAVAHSVAPLLTIPFFVARGCPIGQAIAWPLLAAVVSGYGYRFLARRREHWRHDRHQREIDLARERLAESEKERLRLSRDLHDTVGTTLSLVALYGSLAAHRADDPVEARRLAESIRQAARGALDELRAVLNSLPQSATKLDDLAAGLAVVARRASEPAGAVVSIEVARGGGTVLKGPLRVAVARVFQEAVHNALHHGHANEIRASLAADVDRIVFELADNGSGFDTAAPRGGTGIPGMRARASELGGTATVESTPGQGTRLRVELPLPSTDAA
ncbi:MAG TPA: sensor histidine kinase [Polyangia bacterium]|nr:sensor histidine kinase [Polyangia bacterium]